MATSFKDIFANVAREFFKEVELGKLFSAVSIDGVEVTQAIQYYHADRHLTDPADQGSDNSIPLVRYKPAWVRVYARTFAGSRAVTGRLRVERRMSWMAAPMPPTFLDPVAPGSVTAVADPDYGDERGMIGASLNFVIPADLMSGKLRITAQIWSVDGGDADHLLDSYEVSVDVLLRQTLALRGILVSYDGPDLAGTANITLAAPTVADLTATAAWSCTTMPVESTPLASSAGTLEWDTPLTGLATSPGGCSNEWYALNAELADIRTNDGARTDVIYYGLLPAGIPVANVGGCATDSVTSGRNGRAVTMAHEVGHACGLGHAPCGTPGDATYPAYEPWDAADTPNASIGEYGLDINTGEIRRPDRKDLMSYCGGDWFSLHNYRKLFDNERLNPSWMLYYHPEPDIPVLIDPWVWPWEELIPPYPEWEMDLRPERVQPLLSLIAIVSDEDVVNVRAVSRVDAVLRQPGTFATDYSLQLLDAKGGVIGEASLMRLPGRGGCDCRGCSGKGDGGGHDDGRPPFVAQAMLPASVPGAEMRVVRRIRDEDGKRREAKTIWAKTAPKTPARVDDVRVTLKGSRGTIAWKTKRGDGELRHSIQFSKDKGRSWNSLAVGLTKETHAFETEPLPSGELLFRVLAHDGFHSVSAVSSPVKLAARPPIPVILYPRARTRAMEGMPLRLWGATAVRDPAPRDGHKFRWTIDGKEAGKGRDIWIAAPKAGRHICELVVEDGAGKARTSVEFETLPAGREKRGSR